MNIQHYWAQMQPRERHTLLGGGIAAAVLLLYALVWVPFDQLVTRLERTVADERGTLAWMQQAAEEAKRLRRSQPAHGSGGSLLALTDQSAKSAGLTVTRAQPDGQHAVRVWLDNASFDTTLRWLDQLGSRNGVRVTALVAERSGNGTVTLRLSLEEGQ